MKNIEVFEHQMYGSVVTEEDKKTQVEEGYDPVSEVEAIVAKKGKGKKAEYLVKWEEKNYKSLIKNIKKRNSNSLYDYY